MNNDTKVIIGISLLTLLVVSFIVFNSGQNQKGASPSLLENGGVATGSAQPQATLVEFSDFQCPACKAFEPTVNKVLQVYGGKIRFIYRNFPLPQHPLAFKAAQAALAAQKQDQFWKYKTELFAEQENLSEKSFEEIAKKLKLNLDQFRKDLNSDGVTTQVQRDLKDAQSLNLPGTPSFFLDGQKLDLTKFEDLLRFVAEKIK